jgi:pimeloyl-ACP methyl ester carboxylesterase
MPAERTGTASVSRVDTALVERAAALAGADGEFGLMAAGWTGSITLLDGDRGIRLALRDGRPAGVAATAGGLAHPSAAHVLVRAQAAHWAGFLAPVPVPPYADLFGAARAGVFGVEPLLTSAPRHNAVRRFGWLLRFAAGAPEPPARREPARAPGEHDQAVGRYVHLDAAGTRQRLFYEQAGDGIPLLCQHTAAADARQWRHLLEDRRVTDRFRVIAYDLPYHGRSLPGGDRWWAEEYVLTREVAMAVPTALAAALGLDRPVFLGSSVGGMLALDLARYHPEDYRAVIALQGGLRGPGGLTPAGEAVRRFRVDERLVDPALQAARQTGVMSPLAPEAGRQETMLQYAQSAPGVYAGDLYFHSIDHDLRGEAARIDTARCPVHLLTGEFDYAMVPVSERAAAEIPGATLTIMAGLGHFPMSEDHDRLMEYLLPVLESLA